MRQRRRVCGAWLNSASIAPCAGDGSVIMFNWWEHFEATPEVVAPTGSVRPCATRSKQLG
jgi:hypothetical protein